MATTLQVSGMTCSHCVRAVTKALESVAGAERVSVSLEGSSATVEGAADPQALVRAVQSEGYEAKFVEAR
jgi:copper chaperone